MSILYNFLFFKSKNMAITIDQIKELRDYTGVSMTACKTALEEGNGDLEKAVEILRKKGEAKALDRAGRSTGQGVIAIKVENGKAAIVQLQCETDFVAKADDFLALADSLAEKLLKGEIKPEDRDIPEVKDAVLKMGENVQIGDMKLIEGENVGQYVHTNGKIGVVVSLKGGSPELAREIAMHVAATNPYVISPDEISLDLVEKERNIWVDQLKNEGKPENIMQQIMLGKEKKFREENALIKQAFVKDSEKTIEQLLKQADAMVQSFVRFSI